MDSFTVLFSRGSGLNLFRRVDISVKFTIIDVGLPGVRLPGVRLPGVRLPGVRLPIGPIPTIVRLILKATDRQICVIVSRGVTVYRTIDTSQ